MFKKILKTSRSVIADFYDLYMRIPQNYSFFVFGTHGVGLHSLLYYISMMKCKDGRSVLPSSMFTFRRDIDLLGDLITVRFKNKMQKDAALNTTGAWGITFDGGGKKEKWIRRNITKKVPAIVLVRDPLLALTSFANFEIFLQIQNKIDTPPPINLEEIRKYTLNNFRAILGYKTNLDLLQDFCIDVLYIDCQELQGKETFFTLKKIANFLDFTIQDSHDFCLSINSPIQRYFSKTLYCDEIPFYVSSLSRVFFLQTYPDYLNRNNLCRLELDLPILTKNGLGIFVQHQYINNLIDNYCKVEQILNVEMGNYEKMINVYNKYKLNREEVKYWIDSKIRERIIQEISRVPCEMSSKWNF